MFDVLLSFFEINFVQKLQRLLSASLKTLEKYLWIPLSVVLFLFSILFFAGNHCFRRLHNFSLSPEK